MEQKLSNKEIVDIAMKYLGAPCLYGYESHKKTGYVIGYDYRYGIMCSIDSVFLPFHFVSTDIFQLVLTPLSEISDEHAIEIANMLHTFMFELSVLRSNRTGDRIVVVDRGNDETNGNKWLVISGGDIWCEIDEQVHLLNYEDAICITDFLRSKGYALPYKNIDLFEAGIAIKKETK